MNVHTDPFTLVPCRRLYLSERHSVWCLVDAEDYDWITETSWNYGWHAKTKWKLYAKRNVGTARSTVYLHREILQRVDPLPPHVVRHGHHINGNSLDNRRANLMWLEPKTNSAIRARRSEIPELDTIVAGMMRNALSGADRVHEPIPFE